MKRILLDTNIYEFILKENTPSFIGFEEFKKEIKRCDI